MSDIQTATENEVKQEENRVYVPAELTSVQIDKLAKEAFDKWYANWITSQGAKIAAATKLAEEKQAEIAKLNTAYDKLVATLDAESAKAAKKQDWATIASNEAKKATAKAELDKAINKLNGKKSAEHIPGAMEVAKLDWAGIKNSVHYFAMGGASFVVIHSSRAKGKTAEADVFYAMACQKVSVKANELGLTFTESIPTITGDKLVRIEVRPARQTATPTHSRFVEGICDGLREKSLITLSAGTKYQPNKIDARIENSTYDFVVTKE